MHTPQPHTNPMPCIPPLSCMPPTTHAPPAMHATPPCHAHPLPCTPPATHAPLLCGQNTWHTLLKILPCPNFVAGGKYCNRCTEETRPKWTSQPMRGCQVNLHHWSERDGSVVNGDVHTDRKRTRKRNFFDIGRHSIWVVDLTHWISLD